MKNFFFTSLLIFSLSACVEPTVLEKNLEAYVAAEIPEMNRDYKLLDISFIDTITYKDLRAELSPYISYIFAPDSAKLVERREKFLELRYGSKKEVGEWLESVLNGELRDKNEWLKEVRIVFENTDSLLRNFSKIKRFNYEYQHAFIFFYKSYWEYFTDSDVAIEMANIYKQLYEWLDEYKLYFINTDEIFEGLDDQPYRFIIEHNYEAVNEYGNKVQYKKQHMVDCNMDIMNN